MIAAITAYPRLKMGGISYFSHDNDIRSALQIQRNKVSALFSASQFNLEKTKRISSEITGFPQFNNWFFDSASNSVEVLSDTQGSAAVGVVLTTLASVRPKYSDKRPRLCCLPRLDSPLLLRIVSLTNVRGPKVLQISLKSLRLPPKTAAIPT